jgi:RNA polymerase sigma-70 factor (ECF subfamily)
MRKLRDGDEEVARRALARLHRSCWRPLSSVARSVVRSRDSAEDVVADVLATLWARRREVHLRSGAGSYLRAAVRNRSVRWKERNDRLVPLTAEEAPIHAQPSGLMPTPDDDIYAAELREMAERAVGRLRPGRGAVIRMVMQGLSRAEIAGVLRISDNAVASRVGEARGDLEELREQLHRELSGRSPDPGRREEPA